MDALVNHVPFPCTGKWAAVAERDRLNPYLMLETTWVSNHFVFRLARSLSLFSVAVSKCWRLWAIFKEKRVLVHLSGGWEFVECDPGKGPALLTFMANI